MTLPVMTPVGCAAFFLLVACSGSPPVVDSVSFDAVAPDLAGNRSAPGTVAAHAETGSIARVVLEFAPETQHGVALYDGPPLEVASVDSPYHMTLVFRPGVPPGSYSLRVTAIGSSGERSTPFVTDLVLQ